MRKFITHTKKIAFYAFVIVIALFSLFPFYYSILSSLKSGTALFSAEIWTTVGLSFDNYLSLLQDGSFMGSIVNSVIVAGIVVFIALVLSVTAAYALARISFRGRGLLLITILSVCMFPQVAILAGLFELISAFNLYNSLWALILSYMIFILPFTVWVLTTFMRALPIEMEEAAIMDGATPVQIIVKLFLPLMWPALVTVGLLAFIAAWNEFLFALTFISDSDKRTVPVAIAMITGASEKEIPWGNIMAASVIVTLPVIALVLFFQRKIVSGLTAGSVKG